MPFIKKWSKIWAGDRSDDLVAHLIIYLDKSWLKFSRIPQADRVKFIQKWMKNMVNWSRSDFNKEFNQYATCQLDESHAKIGYDQMIDVISDGDRDDIKEWLADIYSNWGDDDAMRLIKMREIYMKLPTTDKVIWDLYFTRQMSLRKIAKHLGINHMSVHWMVTDLKNKIRNEFNN